MSLYLKHEVLEIKDLLELFDLDKIGKSGVKFNPDKLEYLNSMHIRNRFDHYDELESKKCTMTWRKMLLDVYPTSFHSQIRAMKESKLTRVMDVMKIRIHFYKDMLQHSYFFKDPDYEDEIAQRFYRKLK